nr:hypothetical protein Iba_chr10cCG8520 [Ipomoea batatas]
MPHNQNPRGWAENDVANQSLDSENDKAALQTLLTNLQERLPAVETKMEEVEPRISGVENATRNRSGSILTGRIESEEVEVACCSLKLRCPLFRAASSRESAGMDLIADIAPATCKTAAASSAEKPRVGSFSMSYDELTLKEERRNSKGLGTEKGYRDQMLIWFLINFTHPLVYRGFRQVSDWYSFYFG